MKSCLLFFSLGAHSASAAIASAVFSGGPQNHASGNRPIVREAQGFEMNDKLYVFGGFIPEPGNPKNVWNFMSKETWCWTPNVVGEKDGTWTQLSDMPASFDGTTHMGNTADVENGIIYLTGGLVLPPGEENFADAEGGTAYFAYHVDTDEWEVLPNANPDGTGPGGSGAGGASFVNGELHILAGSTSIAPTNIFTHNEPIKEDMIGHHWALNLSTMTWRQLEGPKISRNHLAVASIGTDLYAIGGQIHRFEGCANEAVVEIFDTITETWSFGPPMPRGTGHASASLISFDGHLVLLGGVNDNPGQCKPGGKHMEFGLVYTPGKGWTPINGKITTGATNVCGIMGTGNPYSMYCNTPNGVEFQKLQWTPDAPDIEYGFVPSLTQKEKNQIANLQAAIMQQYLWRYRGRSGTISNLGNLCSAVHIAINQLRVTQVMDAIHDFSLRKLPRFRSVTFLQDHAYKRFVAEWVGVCVARHSKEDINFPMLMGVRRDFDTMVSSGAVVSYQEHVDLLNARSPNVDACSFGRREVYALFYRGIVSQLIANFMQSDSLTFDEAADFVCHSSTSIGGLQDDCDRAVGFARMYYTILSIRGKPQDFMNDDKVPIEGRYNWMHTNSKQRDQLFEVIDSLSGQEEQGAREAYNLYVQFVPDNDFNWNYGYRQAFAFALEPSGLGQLRRELKEACSA